MALTLSVLRCPDAVVPETRKLSGGEFRIGRGADNDWVLADPDRVLSKNHCVLAFRSGGWQLADLSTNGTFLNRDADPVGRGNPRELRDGDRLRLGNYEIEVRIVEEAGWQAAPSGGRAFADPFDDDPFAAPGRQGGAVERDPLLDLPPPSPNAILSSDYDPLAPDPGLRAPTQSDHASALEQAFRPPTPPTNLNLDDWDLDLSTPPTAAPGPAPSPPQGPPPAVGDDWDIDLSPPAPPAHAAPPAPVPPPPPPPRAEPAGGADPFAEPERDGLSAAAMPVPPTLPVATARSSDPPHREASPPGGARAEAVRPAAAVGGEAGGADLMAAFLRGAGMEDGQPADPVVAMERLGAAFRALVAGLRQTLIARATVKGEFRIEQTMIRARGNNPLKFSAGDDDALAALIGAGRRTDMAPAEAVAEALADMRLHELATMAAMQAAVRALVDRFDPAPLRAEGERGGGLLGAQKRARAFELFEKLHEDTRRALADDFDSVFGKTFARAYEQALREVSDKERP